MKLFSRDATSVHLRHSVATHETESHGNYHIGELAVINAVDDTPYVTSVGVCARRDDMPRQVRNLRDKEQATRELEQEAIKASVRSKKANASTKDNESVVDVEAVSV